MKDEKYPYVSECCGAKPKSVGDADTSDFGICSECKQRTAYGYFDQHGTFFTNPSDAVENDAANERDLMRID
jgi:hypothetical protein